MSELLRKQLVNRLQTSEKILPMRNKTPEKFKLVPTLRLKEIRSVSNIKKKEKLEPIPFLNTKRKSEGNTDRVLQTERAFTESITPKPPETASTYKRKVLIKTIPKPKSIHMHGDSTFFDIKPNNLLEFITKIKGNPELHDDFWYFNRGEDFFDLKPTTFNQKSPQDYFTLSYRGIAHFYKGEVNFISLETWERDFYLYRRLKRIPFFNKYRKWKSFSLWMKRRRLNMMSNCSYFLTKNLCYLDEDLQETFLNIRKKCYIISRFDILDLPLERTRSLTEFKEEQKRKAKYRRPDFKKINDGIFANLKVISAFSTDKFVKSNVSRTLLDKDEIYSAKALPYTHEAILRSHLQHIGRFIRLVDYMVIQSKVTHCMHAYTRIDNYLKRIPNEKFNKKKKILFGLDAYFTGLLIHFTPEIDEIRRVIKKAMEKLQSFVCSFSFYSRMHDFYKYVQSLTEFEENFVEDDLSIENIISINQEIEDSQVSIEKSFDYYIDAVEEFAKSWQPYLKQYTNNKQLKTNKFKTYGIEGLSRVIEKYNNQAGVFTKLPEIVEIEIFRLDLRAIKDKLMPSPLSCIEKLQKILPDLALERGSLLLNELMAINKHLFMVPSNIHEYISHIEKVKQVEEKSDNVALRVMDLKEFIQLLEHHIMQVSADLEEKSVYISKEYEKMRNRLNYIYMRSESERQKFLRILKSETRRVDQRLEQINEKLSAEMFKNPSSLPSTVISALTSMQEEVSELYQDSQNFIHYQDILGLPRSNFSGVENTKLTFDLNFSLWNSLHTWDLHIFTWSRSPLAQIDADQVAKIVEKYYRVSQKCKLLEDYGNYTARVLQEKVEKLRLLVPLITDLRSVSLKEVHWKNIEAIVGHQVNIFNSDYTLADLVDSGLHVYSESICEVALRARKEEELEKQLAAILLPWSTLEFQFKYDKDKDLYTFTEIESISNLLEETQVSISAILTNRYIGTLYGTVDKWNKKFGLFVSTFEEWLLCQKKWGELEKIFSSNDISRQIHEKVKRFNGVNNGLKELMRGCYKNPIAIQACTQEGLLHKLRTWNNTLENLQRDLDEYLEKKRKQFTRFFFISNEELIYVLCNNNNQEAVQTSLKNMFEGIYSLNHIEGTDDVESMVSNEGEIVQLPRNTKTRGRAEEWLDLLEKSMRSAIRQEIRDALKSTLPLSRKDWINRYPAQVLCCVDQILWCSGTQSALTSTYNSMDEWIQSNLTNLEELSKLARLDSVHLVKRRAILALITQQVHNRDVVESLRDQETFSNDFLWQQQLRYYLDQDSNEILIKQVSSVISYGYEYLGAFTRLVITPLTERCWMTITGALHMKLGAAASGPAGTGKTESVKDLAKALGRYCVVFNCSEQVTYSMTDRLFQGLCHTGAWTCLDEFNRIDIEVLSVIASQLLAIRNAKLHLLKEFMFEDKLIPINPAMGVFITMNPDYIGRTELPDNLKVLFRTVSMMVPDYTLIAEIMLFSEGFSKAKELSVKMTKLYKLCSEQLSQQDHYDFGLRAVKSVLNMAGQLKLSNPRTNETTLLMKAMKDSNFSKLVQDDLELFSGIMQDLFPHSHVLMNENGRIRNAVTSTAGSLNLEPLPSFVDKVLQLYDIITVRFGVMLIGPPFTGKSSLYKLLAHALKVTETEQKHVNYSVINPKSFTIEELFGSYNEVTQDWKDGIANFVMREALGLQENHLHWVVFDGPVDSMWIENMNTVLDDNMTLCLGNGERMKLSRDMSILFEVENLAAASPATVSRCGMVYCNSDILHWRGYVLAWINTLESWKEEQTDHLIHLFTMFLEKILSFVRKNLKELIVTVDNNLISSTCMLISALIPPNSPRLHDEFQIFKRFLEKVFVFAITWGIGGALDSRSTLRFDQQVSSELTLDLPRGSLFSSYVDSSKRGGEYRYWESLKPSEKLSPSPFNEIFITTADTIKYEYLVKLGVFMKKHVFLIGSTGTGKSSIVKNAMIGLKDKGCITPVFLVFSAHTSSLQTQKSICSKLEYKRKDLLSGFGAAKPVIIVDDANMPSLQEFGAQPPIELLRTLLDFGFFYDRSKHFPQKVLDFSLILTASPPEGGRQPLSSRFTRHFHMVSLPSLSEDSMLTIFTAILSTHNYSGEVSALTNALVGGTVNIYSTVIKDLLPTPNNSHYLFNLRDIAKVIQGVMQGSPRIVNNAEALVKLWVNEVLRVFSDRLTSESDKTWLNELIIKVLAQFFRRTETYQQIFASNRFYGDFVKGDLDMRDRNYEEFPSLDFLSRRVLEFVGDMNARNVSMDFIPFRDALENICKICRVLRMHRGHMMLVGVGGSGKQSLARISAYISHKEIYSVSITKSYKHSSFREDLKTLFKNTAGIRGKPTVFLMTDTQIIHDSFLEDINNLLNSGEIADLFDSEEIEEIEEEMAGVKADTQGDTVFVQFLNRVKKNLSVVLCMSPANKLLRQRIRMFPSLVNCCTISWFSSWSGEALLNVSSSKMQEIGLEDLSKAETEKLKKSLASICVFVHSTVENCAKEYLKLLGRNVYVTPKSYFDMIETFLQIFSKKKEELFRKMRRLLRGIEQLQKTHDNVNEMEVKMKEMQPILEAKKQECEELAQKIASDSIEANRVRDIIEAEEQKVSTKTLKVRRLQEEAETDLNNALPIIESALKALESLNPKDIFEIRTFSSPPALVVFTLESIALLLGSKTDWDSIKRMLNSNFIETLKSFPRDNIPVKTLNKLRNKTNANPNFTPEKVGLQNIASRSLCAWVFAIDNYSKVIKEVQPKKEKLEKMNQALNESMGSLIMARERLQREIVKVKELENSLGKVMEEKEGLSRELAISDMRLKRSSVLTVGLKEERLRWNEKALEFTNSIKNLVGDAYLSSSFISYCGPFVADLREKMLGLWLSKCRELRIPVSPEYRLKDIMSSTFQIQDWQIASLPSDSFSIDSAIIAVNNPKWPLFIDPQQQAKKWIKTMGAFSFKESERDLIKKLEHCMRNGKDVIIEDIGESLPGSLDNLTSKHFLIEGSHISVVLGELQVYLSNTFRLSFSTKLANPNYLPETSIKVCIVNFTVTTQSLQEHLLADVVKIEQPSIEAQNIELIKNIANDNKKLQEIEESILQSLTETTGNILDDGKLIVSLKNSKSISDETTARMNLAEKNREIIEATRERYKQVAVRGALLYFTIAELPCLDNMYQYSLQYFSSVFNTTISENPSEDPIDERVQFLTEILTTKFYSIISAGIFSRDHLVFALMICISIQRDSGVVAGPLWELFLKGAGFQEDPAKNKPKFMSDKNWSFLQALEGFPEFFNICKEVSEKAGEWQAMDSLSSIPSPYSRSLPFHKLLLLRALREDCLIQNTMQYIRQVIRIATNGTEQVLQESSCKDPVIFILKQGVDPLRLIQKLAKNQEMDMKIDIISLGKGQGEKAHRQIEIAAMEGRWVVLQNCHLARSWMQSLEEIVVGLQKNNPNPLFKLFITSMPCEYFSVGLLHICLKVALEPPDGIRSNMLRAVSIIQPDPKSEEINRILMNLCVFHAVVQERCKFGSLGWNIRYDFNESDLDTSSLMIGILTEDDVLHWEALRFVVGEINYGGKVTDEWDRRLLNSLLAQYFNTEAIEKENIFEGSYTIPLPAQWGEFKTAVKALPESGDIEILGLHTSSQVSLQISESQKLLGSILKMQPKMMVSQGNPDLLVEETAKQLLEHFPKPISKSEISAVLQPRLKNGVIDPMVNFLNHEITRFNKLLATCLKSLQELGKALKGQVLMSEDLEGVYSALLNNTTPKTWLKVSYPSLKSLPVWIDDLSARVNFIRNWLKSPPPTYWISAFFFPQGFLTAVLQTYSRKYLTPIDKLSFTFDFFSDAEAEATEGVYIHGLWMEGCRWDFKEMELAEATEIYHRAPIIHFLPMEKNKRSVEDYVMPLYKNTERNGVLTTTGSSSNFIVAIDTPTSLKPVHWVLRSAAYISDIYL